MATRPRVQEVAFRRFVARRPHVDRPPFGSRVRRFRAVFLPVLPAPWTVRDFRASPPTGPRAVEERECNAAAYRRISFLRPSHENDVLKNEQDHVKTRRLTYGSRKNSRPSRSQCDTTPIEHENWNTVTGKKSKIHSLKKILFFYFFFLALLQFLILLPGTPFNDTRPLRSAMSVYIPASQHLRRDALGGISFAV